MVITDVIREADSDHVIYFLLISYINAARYSDKVKSLPDRIAALPLAGKDDVRSRFELLMAELDAASKRLDDDACVTIKEALTTFGIALFRLQSLDHRRARSPDVEMQAA
jgi:hypothetical protein